MRGVLKKKEKGRVRVLDGGREGAERERRPSHHPKIKQKKARV